MDPSGIRIGTPALTTRGMGTEQMTQISAWIIESLQSADDAAKLESIRGAVKEMCESYPVPAAAMLV